MADTVKVRYPGDTTLEYEPLALFGRMAVVQGIPPIRNGYREDEALAESFMVVNTAFETVEYFSHSYVQALGMMRELDMTWDALDKDIARKEQELFAAEDAEEEELPDLPTPAGKVLN